MFKVLNRGWVAVLSSAIFAPVVALFLIVVLLAFLPAAHADSRSSKLNKSATAAGVSAERLQRINSMAKRYIDTGHVPGMITLVARHGKLVHFEVHGQRGFDDPRPLAKDDLFRIYSMSKPITAVAVMQLYEQGKFQLKDPVEKFIPEFKQLKVWQEDGTSVATDTPVTVHQLLTHTAGFSYGFMSDHPIDKLYKDSKHFQASNLDGFAAELAKLPLKFQPGERWNYSVASDILGLLIQRLSGQSLDQYLSQHIFKPLEMNDTFFSVPDDKLERFLPNAVYNKELGKGVTMGPKSVSSFQNVGLFSGGGGLVSTMNDYWNFTEMLRAGGVLNGQRVIGAKTLDYMVRNHLSAIEKNIGSGESPGQVKSFYPGHTFGLGFGIIEDPAADAVVGSKGEYYWGGAAGTVFWVDPAEDLVAIALIQLMASPWPLRADFKTAVYQALEHIGGDQH